MKTDDGSIEYQNIMSEKIRILFILQTFRTGGSERVVKDLCENLSSRKFQPFVISLTDGEMHEEFRNLGIPTVCIHKQGKDALETIRKVSSYCSQNHIQLINAHHMTPFFYGFFAAKLNRCKLLYTAHSCWEVEGVKKYWPAVGKFMLKFSEGGIGISRDVSDSIHRKYGLNYTKVFTIQNSINISRFETAETVFDKKKEFGFKNEDRVIGSVGSLKRQKNYPNLIAAFNLIKQRMDHVKLLIVGEGKRRSDLMNLIEKLGLVNDVIIAGSRSDIPELMQIMDVYCLPSDMEGIPLTLLEAMAASRPIVGTDIIGIRDVVANEKTGLLVPPNDPQALSRALIRILQSQSLSKMLSANAQRYVHEKHDTRKWIKSYEDLFIEIAKCA